MPDKEKIPLRSISDHIEFIEDFMMVEHVEPGCRSLSPHPHRHEWYEVQYFSRGYGQHIIDFQPHSLKIPCLYFVSPGQVHFWRLTPPVYGFGYIFTAEFLTQTLTDPASRLIFDFFEEVREHPLLHLNEEQHETVRFLTEKIHQEYLSRNNRSDPIIKTLLLLLMHWARKWSGAIRQTQSVLRPGSLVTKFRRLIENHFTTDRSVASYAARLNVSPAHLSDQVKNSLGKTPKELIRERVLLEAKRLLIHSQNNINEVGDLLGFDDPSYFSRFFRQCSGQSPKQFKEQFFKRHLL